jgi:hypothetical protein
VARSNVCPEIDPPAEPSFYAFSFTRPSQGTTPSFVIAGSGESQEGNASYAERTVRYRDISPEGIAEKVRYVAGVMERRMGEFGFGWKDATAAQTYTIHDFHHGLRRCAGSPRRRAGRIDLAFCAAAGDRPGIRDGLPAGVAGDCDLADPHPEEPRERRLQG